MIIILLILAIALLLGAMLFEDADANEITQDGSADLFVGESRESYSRAVASLTTPCHRLFPFEFANTGQCNVPDVAWLSSPRFRAGNRIGIHLHEHMKISRMVLGRLQCRYMNSVVNSGNRFIEGYRFIKERFLSCPLPSWRHNRLMLSTVNSY